MVFPKVYIIIVNYNGWQDTIECLNSLKKLTYPNYETIVVDNKSTNNSVEQLKKNFPTKSVLHLITRQQKKNILMSILKIK